MRSALLGHGGHDTTAFERGDRLPAEAFALTPVLQGEVQVIDDLATDGRVADRPRVPGEGRGVRAAGPGWPYRSTLPGASSAR